MFQYTSGSGTKAKIFGIDLSYDIDIQVSGQIVYESKKEFIYGVASYESIQGSISGTIPLEIIPSGGILSGTGSIIVEDNFFEIPGSIDVINVAHSQVSGSIFVTAPHDLSGSLAVTRPSDLHGQITVLRDETVDISGSITIVDVYAQYTQAKLTVVRPADLQGTLRVQQSGIGDLSGSITVPFVGSYDHQATLSVTNPEDISGSISVAAPKDLFSEITVASPVDINARLEVVKASDDISGTVTVTRPVDIAASISVAEPITFDWAGSIQTEKASADLPGSIEIRDKAELDISGSIQVVIGGQIDLNASIQVALKLDDFLSGTLVVTRPIDLPGQISVERQSGNLSGTLLVGPVINRDISGTLVVVSEGFATFPVTLEVVKASDDISGSLEIQSYADMAASIEVEPPSQDLSGTIDVLAFGFQYLASVLEIIKNDAYISGSITTIGGTFDLYSSIQVVKNTGHSDMSGGIIVKYAGQYNATSRIDVLPNANLSGTLPVIRPYGEIAGRIEVRSKFDGNVGIDESYSHDRLRVSVKNLELVEGKPAQEIINIFPSGSHEFSLLPVIKASGTEMIVVGSEGTRDSFSWFQYRDENVEWSYPVQLTDNIHANNIYYSPSITISDGAILVAYGHNYNNELKRTYVIRSEKTDITQNERWTIGKLYHDAQSPQFIGESGSIIFLGVDSWINHPGLQLSKLNDFMESELVFTPESYDPIESIYRDLWDTIQYQMQRDGVIVYPAPQWNGENPIAELINAQIDSFIPVPITTGTEPSGTQGFFRLMGNFYTGNGG